MAGSSPEERTARSLARDLFSLEINTILKPQITGGQMPAVRFALCQVARVYAAKLRELGAIAPGTLESPDGGITGGFETFDRLQAEAKAAKERMGGPGEGLSEAEASAYYMLDRIRGNANRIKQIFELRRRAVATARGLDVKSPKLDDDLRNDWDNAHTVTDLVGLMKQQDDFDMDLDREDFAALRKIWEIGVEQIVMQTVVKLDGDVITRVHPALVKPEYEMLHKIHGSSVDVSLSYWKSLVDILVTFIGAIFRFLFTRGDRIKNLIKPS